MNIGLLMPDFKTSHVTNFDTYQRGKYEMAIKIYHEKTGVDRLFIMDDAYDWEGTRIYSLNALHDKSKGNDLSDFWRIFEKIEMVWTYNE